MLILGMNHKAEPKRFFLSHKALIWTYKYNEMVKL